MRKKCYRYITAACLWKREFHRDMRWQMLSLKDLQRSMRIRVAGKGLVIGNMGPRRN